jgi:hypothetical protein
MPDLIVVDHHLDADAGLYRLVIGYAEEHTQAVLDEDGLPMHEPGTLAVATVAKLDDNGDVVRDENDKPIMEEQPMLDSEGNQIVLLGDPLMETVTVHVPVEDFVFAADDERWQGLSEADIAQKQRSLVKRALTKRHKAAEAAEVAAAAARTELPGAGDAL